MPFVIPNTQCNTNTGGVFGYCSTMSQTLGKLLISNQLVHVVAINVFVDKIHGDSVSIK